MFDQIIAFSIRNKLTIGLMTCALILVGIYSAYHLPVDAQPDITNNQVQIITQAPNLGAQEVEQFITAPIELAMANISGIIEKRSISRSGISVLTLVFKDDIDVYWARAQVNAQLKEAESLIPSGIAEPMLAPISTGMGEIYQYVIHAKKGYEDRYTATDLRTLQDWLVRTQLAGTVGVAEVSGWGGYVKQYEIALQNDKLHAFGLTIPEIYTALEKNNENTGGSYIEQQSSVYFIRGLGQVQNLEDIRKIVVKNINGAPILIGDIAKVQFGSAVRYGAVTRNGEGEAVAGITLMLKGENFSEVIKNVKAKMVQIQKSLPEGVVIEPYIDRTELVNRAIGTVKTNLMEGALIVIFVLVLLLGNWRAGLVVASVIPLAMLFAFSMMQLFGVSGNLMSLGAIDFGLIVDGAVIIVESVVHHIHNGRYRKEGILKLSAQQMDDEVRTSAGKLMKSAAFGQIIILIVYLPLLSLVGIEGKMFKPMAQTVAFAILGAFILSLTYVPVASALFLSKHTHPKRNFSDRLIEFLQRIYQQMLVSVLKIKVALVSFVFILFAITIWVFSNMGGEFIPTLEEGDLAMEISMMQGASLTEVVKTFSKAEKILKDKFPEIKQAVTRIGSAEIPTDPMPIEKGDMLLSMKPKKEWVSASSRQEMMDKIEEALAVIPGIHVELSQPMQLRFNELMTGIRQDVAIKIYGDDLDVLAAEATKIARLIEPVRGVGEPYIEKVNGLPQIQVAYNRNKIAQYGLNISDLNLILKTAFAGSTTGVVFEGEKRFDMVLRLDRSQREDISGVENLLIPLPSGHKIPLNQVATIAFMEAPAQISRENGNRRIFVGFNVQGRDVESTVKEIHDKLDTSLQLPSGYYMTYGGQFQNLQTAKTRLLIAVPAALVLILLLLYVTFRSVKDSLLIFTAVPLAAMGGVAALLLRGMPFSISAGVGFIALFGVAVLNGIVLIGYFNQLKEEGMDSIYERVLEGTKTRLRPVLMTAAVASFGFLPMALSTSAGAEVQKPLATVVIGGLIVATFLTLFVLPCLYLLFNRKEESKVKLSKPIVMLCLVGIFTFFGETKAYAQEPAKPLTLERAIAIALENNLQMRRAKLDVAQATVLQRSGVDLPKTEFSLSQDATGGGGMDNGIGISQNLAWPGLYSKQRKSLQQQRHLAEKKGELTAAELTRSVREAWYNQLLNYATLKVLSFQDSLYGNFVKNAEIRVKSGETSRLELISAQTQQRAIEAALLSAKGDVKNGEMKLRQLLQLEDPILMESGSLTLAFDLSIQPNISSHALAAVAQQEIEVAKTKMAVEKAKAMPDLNFGYNHQLLINGFNPANISRTYTPGTRIAGWQVGLAIPLFNQAGRARLKAETLSVKAAEVDYQNAQSQLALQYQQQWQHYETFKKLVDRYTNSALKQADEQLRIAQVSFKLGEIGYMEFVEHATQSIQTKLAYLEALSGLNEATIQLLYLKGN